MIKNFIYLNESKLYSFSSQLFEGVTEYILEQQHTEHTDQETQKGKLATGRVIADVIKEAASSTTKKFLHDHAFNLFEDELIQSNGLLDVSTETLSFSDVCQSQKSFIRIRAKGTFIDLVEIQNFFNNYAEISEALATLPRTVDIQELERNKANHPKSQDTKNQQSNLDKEIKIATLMLSANLPRQSVKGFQTVIENFGDDIVRFQQQVSDVTFSSCLSQEHLRESLQHIYRKYSRKTAKEFTVLGFISHSDGTQKPDMKNVSVQESFIQHMIGLAENMHDLEEKFAGKKTNEIIIEPIAIYTEL